MKHLIYGSVFVFLTLTLLPVTADAFSRRSHSSEVMPTQQTTTLNRTTSTETQNVSAQAVPEPPALLLMTIGVGLFVAYAVAKRRRTQA